jgi:hypothetical protein
MSLHPTLVADDYVTLFCLPHALTCGYLFIIVDHLSAHMIGFLIHQKCLVIGCEHVHHEWACIAGCYVTAFVSHPSEDDGGLMRGNTDQRIFSLGNGWHPSAVPEKQRVILTHIRQPVLYLVASLFLNDHRPAEFGSEQVPLFVV